MSSASTAPGHIRTGEPVTDRLSFLWLEITGKCQLRCAHCYSDSGPRGTHGSMTMADWMRVIDQAAALRVSLVQFIGGEPTLHPHLPALIQHALSRMMEVEVYTNLSHVSEGLWRLLERDRIGLTVTVDGRHRIWLDTPNSEHAWDPAHHPTSETSH
jgi:MoaA/NifB/PqqE/SkfB family radical SAM enzyme